MAKSLSSLWLKSMRRVSKAQQAQGMRLFESMLPKAALAKKPRRPPLKALKLVAAVPAKTSLPPRKPAVPLPRRRAPLPACPAPGAKPGLPCLGTARCRIRGACCIGFICPQACLPRLKRQQRRAPWS
jgi:hypothetical protein